VQKLATRDVKAAGSRYHNLHVTAEGCFSSLPSSSYKEQKGNCNVSA